MTRTDKIIILSIGLSLLIHSVFFASSGMITLGGMSSTLDETRRMFKLREVEDVPEEVDLFKKEVDNRPPAVEDNDLLLSENMTFYKMISEEEPERDLNVESKKEDVKKESFDKDLSRPLERFDNGEILEIESKYAMEKALPDRRNISSDLKTEGEVNYSVITAPIGGEGSFKLPQGIASRPKGSLDADLSSDAEDVPVGERGFTPIASTAQIGEYDDIGSFLDVELLTYKDPKTEEKYFRLSVKVEERGPLEVIPKEVIFLIDSSKSMTEQKLVYVKEGLEASLGNMNEGDRFNVVAFRGNVSSYKRDPVYASRKTVEEAKKFVDELEAKGQTDVENALKDIVSQPLDFVPSYVVFVTDGRPTTGMINSRRINQQITRVNDLKRPIFCFGGGRRVNRYLLDFLSYQNRAWSYFSSSSYEMKNDFIDFYREIKDPLLLNVRYRVNSIKREEVYPKRLPDFYRGKPFSLYGRITDENKFSVQLLGEAKGAVKEFIFQGQMNKAQKGTREIAREWAFRKIYYLISLITLNEGDEAKLKREIKELSRNYGITTPYDLEYED